MLTCLKREAARWLRALADRLDPLDVVEGWIVPRSHDIAGNPVMGDSGCVPGCVSDAGHDGPHLSPDGVLWSYTTDGVPE